jgi:hypothetical protein
VRVLDVDEDTAESRIGLAELRGASGIVATTVPRSAAMTVGASLLLG